MRPTRLTLTNWMPFTQEELDLGPIHVAALTGENGAGKSSILDALTWALWGKARGDSDEDRIRAGAQQCVVRLVFEVNGQTFSVARSKKRGKGKASGQSLLTLERQMQPDLWDDITGATMKETQAAIIDLIKMDYQTFCSSVFLRQGHSDQFTAADPADRKRVLINILALDQYDALEVSAKDRLKEIDAAIAVSEAQGNQAMTEAGRSATYEALQQDASTRLAGATERVTAQEHALKALEAQAAQLQPKRDELGKLKNDQARTRVQLSNARDLRETHASIVASYQKAIEGTPTILKGYEDLQKAEADRGKLAEVARVSGEVSQKRGRLALTISQAESKLRSDLAKADTIVRQLSSSKPEYCPTCGQAMNPERQAEIADKLTQAKGTRDALKDRLLFKEYAQAEQKELAQLDTKAQELGESMKEWDKVQADVKRLEPYRKLHHALQEAEANIQRAQGFLKDAETSVKSYEDALKTADSRITELTNDLTNAGEIDRQLRNYQEAVTQAKREVAAAQQSAADMQAKIDFARQCQAQAQEIEEKLAGLRRQADVYKFLAGAFNKAGIPSEIIKAAVPELEAEANTFLGEMTEGRMSLALSTVRDNKSGTTTETLDILISDELGTRAYEMYSGGEAFKVNLSLRLALSKMVANRAGAPTSCLFIDEGFGTQDQNGLTKVIEALHSVEDKFQLVLIITHLDELREEFGTQIRVTKEGTGSKVAVLN